MHPGLLVRLELRIGDANEPCRSCRHMFVASPASGRVVLVDASSATPHRDAALLYLGARSRCHTLELVHRREATDSVPAIWTFVATLELPDA